MDRSTSTYLSALSPLTILCLGLELEMQKALLNARLLAGSMKQGGFALRVRQGAFPFGRPV